jgi:hypothetical protein
MANFSTLARVRSEAGLTSQTNISDTVITGYHTQANGVLCSYVAGRYNISNLVASADFTGSKAESFLQRVEEMLGAGYLLLKVYGPDGGGDMNKDGTIKIDQAMQMLTSLSEGVIRLLKNDGTEFEQLSDKKTGSGIKKSGFNRTPTFSIENWDFS